MGMVYQPVGSLSFGRNDALVQAAGETIDAIRAEHGGVCPAEEYVERARPESSPIHETLPWDDRDLAEQKRREIAAQIVRYVVRVEQVETRETITYPNVSVTTLVDDRIERGSVPYQEVVARPDWLSQTEREFLRRLRGDCENHAYLPLAKRVLSMLDALDAQQGARAA